MADKSVGELIAAQSVTPTDLFVLEQNGTAKKLTGQILENWLVSFADGHGGIQSIKKLSTSGLVDTYRITLADTTTFDFVVTNGRSINSIAKTSTSGLVDTYTITYNNGTTSKFTVTNGAKGDKGDNSYVWIKYASRKPSESSHSMGDIPDDWIGIYSGNASTAPTGWQQYKWFKHKGEKGDTGSPATLATKSVTYQVSDSGTIIPSGAWGSSIPVVSPGKYLWTKTELRFNTGEPIVSYSVARMGIDGSGSVSSVAGVSPDSTGNVTLTAADVGALAVSGGDMEGAINMNGQPISGLNDPTEDTQAARKGYVDNAVRKAAPRNLLDNSDFRNPVNQRGASSYTGNFMLGIDRWIATEPNGSVTETITDNGITFSTSSGGQVYLIQRFEKGYLDISKPHTIAVCIADGTVIIAGYIDTSDENVDTVNAIFSSGSTVQWVALYEGEYTADNLPVYQPNGYGAELLECQRYYLHGVGKHCPGLILADGSIKVFVPTPVTMRITPTATAISLDNAVYNNGTSRIIALNSIASIELKPTGVYVVFNTALTSGQDMFHTLMTFDTTLHLSAEL